MDVMMTTAHKANPIPNILTVIRLLAAHFRWSLPKADRFGPVQPQELSENDENTQEI